MGGTIPAAAERAERTARAAAGLSFALLLVQNALGLYLNLYVTLARPAGIGSVFPVLVSNPVLIAHGVNAMALLGLAILLAVVGGRARAGRTVRGLGLASILALAVTAYLGYHFVATQENGYSFGMELGYLSALALQAAILYRVRPDRDPPPGPARAIAPGEGNPAGAS